jgi:hypothetical protein
MNDRAERGQPLSLLFGLFGGETTVWLIAGSACGAGLAFRHTAFLPEGVGLHGGEETPA